MYLHKNQKKEHDRNDTWFMHKRVYKKGNALPCLIALLAFSALAWILVYLLNWLVPSPLTPHSIGRPPSHNKNLLRAVDS